LADPAMLPKWPNGRKKSGGELKSIYKKNQQWQNLVNIKIKTKIIFN